MGAEKASTDLKRSLPPFSFRGSELFTCLWLSPSLPYWKVVRLNTERRKSLKGVLPEGNFHLLGGDYPGIEISGLPKGFQVEASVAVTIAGPPST